MKTLLKAALVCLPLIFAIPEPTNAQVSIQLNFGDPYVRPWPDAVWYDGYYYGGVWVPGRWHHHGWHDNGRHVGWYKGRGGEGRGHGGHGGGHGRGRGH